MMRRAPSAWKCFALLLFACLGGPLLRAQDPSLRFGQPIPPEVDTIYERGLAWLATAQADDGSWKGSNEGCGVDGICLMAFLASGEDPNYGRYAATIRRAIARHHPPAGREDRLPAQQHVPPRLCHARALRGVRRGG